MNKGQTVVLVSMKVSEKGVRMTVIDQRERTQSILRMKTR